MSFWHGFNYHLMHQIVKTSKVLCAISALENNHILWTIDFSKTFNKVILFINNRVSLKHLQLVVGIVLVYPLLYAKVLPQISEIGMGGYTKIEYTLVGRLQRTKSICCLLHCFVISVILDIGFDGAICPPKVFVDELLYHFLICFFIVLNNERVPGGSRSFTSRMILCFKVGLYSSGFDRYLFRIKSYATSFS